MKKKFLIISAMAIAVAAIWAGEISDLQQIDGETRNRLISIVSGLVPTSTATNITGSGGIVVTQPTTGTYNVDGSGISGGGITNAVSNIPWMSVNVASAIATFATNSTLIPLASATDGNMINSTNFPSNVVQTNLTLTAGSGLLGGGSLDADRSFALDWATVKTTNDNLYVSPSTLATATNQTLLDANTFTTSATNGAAFLANNQTFTGANTFTTNSYWNASSLILTNGSRINVGTNDGNGIIWIAPTGTTENTNKIMIALISSSQRNVDIQQWVGKTGQSNWVDMTGEFYFAAPQHFRSTFDQAPIGGATNSIGGYCNFTNNIGAKFAGNVTGMTRITAGQGSSANPAYSFSLSANSGMWLPSAGIINMQCSATPNQQWTASAVSILQPLYITNGASASLTVGQTGQAIKSIWSSTSVVNFTNNLNLAQSEDQFVTVTGANTNDVTSIGAPVDIPSDSVFTAFVSSNSTITIRRRALTNANPFTNKTWRVQVIQY